MALSEILPGTGRGTMRSMVEGVRPQATRLAEGPLHHAASRRGPPPRAGEDHVSFSYTPRRRYNRAMAPARLHPATASSRRPERATGGGHGVNFVNFRAAR